LVNNSNNNNNNNSSGSGSNNNNNNDKTTKETTVTTTTAATATAATTTATTATTTTATTATALNNNNTNNIGGPTCGCGRCDDDGSGYGLGDGGRVLGFVVRFDRIFLWVAADMTQHGCFATADPCLERRCGGDGDDDAAERL
jgi:hypothetical protein